MVLHGRQAHPPRPAQPPQRLAPAPRRVRVTHPGVCVCVWVCVCACGLPGCWTWPTYGPRLMQATHRGRGLSGSHIRATAYPSHASGSGMSASRIRVARVSESRIPARPGRPAARRPALGCPGRSRPSHGHPSRLSPTRPSRRCPRSVPAPARESRRRGQSSCSAKRRRNAAPRLKSCVSPPEETRLFVPGASLGLPEEARGASLRAGQATPPAPPRSVPGPARRASRGTWPRCIMYDII